MCTFKSHILELHFSFKQIPLLTFGYTIWSNSVDGYSDERLRLEIYRKWLKPFRQNRVPTKRRFFL